jgi:hypothetical protein
METDQGDEKEEEGQIIERIYLLEKAVKTMEDLFSLFLKTRLSPQQQTEENARIARWLEN